MGFSLTLSMAASRREHKKMAYGMHEYAAAKIHCLTTDCFEDWQRELWLWPLQRFLCDCGHRAQFCKRCNNRSVKFVFKQKDFINPVGPLPSFTICNINKTKKCDIVKHPKAVCSLCSPDLPCPTWNRQAILHVQGENQAVSR